MRKSSPSTYLLLAILQLAGYLYSVTHHATQTCFDFFAVIGILGVCWPNFNSRKPTRHLYPVVITFHFLYYQYEQNSVREPIQSSNLLQHLICKSFQSKCLCLFSHRKNQWNFLTTHTMHDRIAPSRGANQDTHNCQDWCQENLLHMRLSQSNCLVFEQQAQLLHLQLSVPAIYPNAPRKGNKN